MHRLSDASGSDENSFLPYVSQRTKNITRGEKDSFMLEKLADFVEIKSKPSS
jgi:hypothetical protein